VIFGRHANGSLDVIHNRSAIALADPVAYQGAPLILQAEISQVTCPDGSKANTLAQCSSSVITTTSTGDPMITCWDGTTALVGKCPPILKCPNGTYETDLSKCPAQGVFMQTCSNGSRIPGSATCPTPWYLQWYVLYPAIGAAAYFLWGTFKPKSNPVLSGLPNFGKRKR
jgi:hypothetical protein